MKSRRTRLSFRKLGGICWLGVMALIGSVGCSVGGAEEVELDSLTAHAHPLQLRPNRPVGTNPLENSGQVSVY
jgi:hypothetical protein